MNYKKKIKIYFLLALLALLSVNLSAQFPYGINYQAVARNTEGYPISNTEIVIEISILKGISNEIVWQETHIGNTDKFGLLNLVIGEGANTLVGSATEFKDIDWESDKFFVKVRADFGDESFVNGMVDLGVTSLQSVPYALVAARALEAPLPKLSDVVGVSESGLSLYDGLAWDGTKWDAGDFFLLRNGTSDLSGDWTIVNNSISLTKGTLSAKNLKTNLGASINEFSIDDLLGSSTSSDNVVSTQKAVKTYVDITRTNTYIYIDNKFAATWLTTGNYLYNLTKKIGIGTDTPLDKFHAALDKAGFLVTGTYSYNEPLNSQLGSSMMFFPSRSAFRAGYSEGQWSNIKIGEYSAAFGRNTEASGGYSFSAGFNNVASGTQSSVSGVNNIASQATAVVFGQNNKAEGRSSFLMGEYLVSDSYLQSVFGRYNQKKTSPGPDPINYQIGDQLFVIGYGSDEFTRKNAFTVMKNGNIGIKTDANLPPTSTLVVNGSLAVTVNTVNVNTTLSDLHNVVLVDASAGAKTITLPDATTCAGRQYTIKKIDATVNAVVVSGGSIKIDDVTFKNITTQWTALQIVSNGTQWYIVN